MNEYIITCIESDCNGETMENIVGIWKGDCKGVIEYCTSRTDRYTIYTYTLAEKLN